jgi:hypothetical protein
MKVPSFTSNRSTKRSNLIRKRVDVDRPAGAHLLVFALLKDSQELRLQRQGKVADFARSGQLSPFDNMVCARNGDGSHISSAHGRCYRGNKR